MAHIIKRRQLYGVFFTRGDVAYWAMSRRQREATRYAKSVGGYVLAMADPAANLWDAPTFKVCADRVVVDYRQTTGG